jgi:hypothetical protein
MRAQTTLIVGAIAVLTGPLRVVAQTSWFGTWNVNVAKSTYAEPPPYKRMTCRIEPWEEGVRVTYDMVRTRGGITHLEWTGRFDGRDYPVQGVDYVLTNAYNRIDDRTYEVIQKVDGQVTAIARATIAHDSSSITTTTRGKDARGQEVTTTVVYEKR